MRAVHGVLSSPRLIKQLQRPTLLQWLIFVLIFYVAYYTFIKTAPLTDGVSGRSLTDLSKYARDSPGSVCSTLRFEDIKLKDPLSQQVIDYVRCNHLFPPSEEQYALTDTEPSRLKKEIEQIFQHKRHGFFVECGAHDGQFLSNTLELEMRLNWTGLLVEADPVLQKKLLGKHRKAWVADVCASPTNSVTEIDFFGSNVVNTDDKSWMSAIGRLNDPAIQSKHDVLESIGTVKCFPLPTLLAAIGVKHVDFLSLDVEGVDLKVLETFPPREQLSIDVVVAEYSHVPEGKDAMRSFMESRGYRTVAEAAEDYVFVHSEK